MRKHEIHRKNATSGTTARKYCNLKRTYEDSLPCFCYAVKINSRTIPSQASQPSSAGKWVNWKLIQNRRQKVFNWELCVCAGGL